MERTVNNKLIFQIVDLEKYTRYFQFLNEQFKTVLFQTYLKNAWFSNFGQ